MIKKLFLFRKEAQFATLLRVRSDKMTFGRKDKAFPEGSGMVFLRRRCATTPFR